MIYLSTVTTLTFCLFVFIVGYYYILGRNGPGFPVLNDYPGDIFRRRAYKEYRTNAKQLLAEGSSKYQEKPFAVLVPNGIKVILPPSLTNWIKTNKDLDHQQLVRDEYFATYPGFEAQLVLHHPNRLVINIVQAKLAKNDQTLPTLNDHIKSALAEYWGEGNDWHLLDWDLGTSGLISRAAASTFVGPELATDVEWQSVTRSYVQNFFAAVSEMHAWHHWLRPFVQWYLPHASACRTGVKRARSMINAVVRERHEKVEVAEANGDVPPEYNDALAWTLNAPGGSAFEAGDVQLALAMAAFFTTAEVLRQVIIEIVHRPQLVASLRQEIEEAISNHGLTAASLFRMELLDSAMKESQRLMPALVGFERLVTRDTKLPDGTPIKKGTHVAVDSHEMWSADVYDKPEEYDAWRFIKRREAGITASQFVQSSREHNSFGVGKHQCPGRFFANNELKLCLVRILLNYDMRIEDGYSPKPMRFGFVAIADPCARIEVRKREN